MSCPYHYEEKKKSKLPLIAGLAVGAVSIGYTLFKQQSAHKGQDEMKSFNKKVGHEFYMPHFMVKNVRLETAETTLTVNVDYRINKVLNDYLVNNRPDYYFKLILPEQYQSLFEENERVIKGEDLVGGEDRADYTVSFQFEAKPQTKSDEIKAIEVSDKIQMTILDDENNVLNDFPDVYNAANIIRY
ncbi:hypothetical protein ERX37_10700 [Macrococcus hajekii]|uniref:Uncharacterized protein n=1 Tax=Macrococcus hajekii TaxID=198482 RepID=A0A4R6BHS9_9STAP|nr:hypothetical protein [Macrococcus hajekii]TDM01141.1 hypothetical protein ERX37_10700 [Macrococcus hajekii]GGB12141.1 hypothetical protein GCM10007190_20240 [Macrococcus hajekii]